MFSLAVHRIHKCILSCLILAASLTGLSASTWGQDVVIIAGDNLKYTRRTISGAKGVISQKSPNAVFHKFNLAEPEPSHETTIDSVKSLKPALVLTVGSSATEFARDNFPNTPIVFSAVMYPAISGFTGPYNKPVGNMTGASLDIPAEIQFDKFKKIIPGMKNIGVLYTNNTSSLIRPSIEVANSMGMNLHAIKIEDLKEIPRALDSLAKSVDGIWSVADPNLFSPQSTKYILLNSLRKGVPIMGFSRYVVESGALFALDFDYKAIGRQAGGIANRIIGGTRPSDIPVTAPDIIWFHYNEKTAEHLNCTIPDELMAIAKEVYR